MRIDASGSVANIIDRKYRTMSIYFLHAVLQVGEVTRKRGPLVIETYVLDLLEGPKGDVLDRSPPPELE
jgi:hypothetical protein